MSLVELTISEKSATVRLNRVEQRNALNRQLLEELNAALDEIVEARPNIVFLCANGPAFSAGLDRAEMSKLVDAQAAHVDAERRSFYTQGTRLKNLEATVIGVLEGPAVTGGVGLAALCDFRLATRSAWLKVTFAELGFYAGLGMSETLYRTGGPSFARRLLLLAERLEAEEAFRLGFYDWLVEPDQVDEAVTRLAGLANAVDPAVVRMMKRKLAYLDDIRLDSVIAEEAALEALTSTFEGFKDRAPRFAANAGLPPDGSQPTAEHMDANGGQTERGASATLER
jgi:methylglutaconyl-CoA hydratase